MVRTCPRCGEPARPQPVYRHRWWVCPRCGDARREARDRLPADHLPAWARRRLPGVLGSDAPAAPFFDPARYASPDAAGTPYAGEAAKVRGLLARFGLAATGRVLDLSGGPGFAAADLQRGGARVVMTDLEPHIVRFAREVLGVEARVLDFAGPPVDRVVAGPFDLVLARYCLNWCADPARLAAGLARVAAPGAHLLIAGFLPPTRGAMLTSALEPAAPVALWTEATLRADFGLAGWQTRAAFEVDPPMAYWAPRGLHAAAFGLPWLLAGGPVRRGVRQVHRGLVLRRG